MDPDTALAEALEAAGRILAGRPEPDDATELAERLSALDEWIRRGGMLPARWGAARGG